MRRLRRWWWLCLAVLAAGSIAVGVALAAVGVFASPTSLDFQQQDVSDGPTADHTSVVQNNSGGDVAMAVALNGTNADQFSLDTSLPDDCSNLTTLPDGSSCNVRVSFDPDSGGSKSAEVDVTTPAGSPTISLTGGGTERALSLSDNSFNFGGQTINTTSSPFDSTVTNSGTGPVTLGVLSISGADGDQFDFESPAEPGDCQDNEVLGEGGSCTVHFVFAPTSTGGKSAHISIPSNAPSSPDQIDMSGTGTQPILDRSPDTLNFAQDIDEGPSMDQTSTVTNTGSEPVSISGVDITGADPADFTQLTDQPNDCKPGANVDIGNTCDLRFTFDPATTGMKTATATVQSNAPDISVTLNGDAQQTELTLSPTSLTYGNQEIAGGATLPKEATLTNTGTQTVSLTSINPTGDTGDFPHLTGQPSDCTGTTTLTAGQSCKLRYAFDPSSTGAKQVDVGISGSGVPDQTLTLTGTGIDTKLTPTPTSFGFGSVDIDEGPSPTSPQTFTFTNTGDQTVNVSSVSIDGTDPSQFHRLTGNASDCSSTTTLTTTSPNDTCEVRIEFDPSSIGAKSATATVHSNAPDSTVSFTGTGIDTKITPSPATLAFGKQDIDNGATSAMTSTVTNTGSEPVTFTDITTTGGDAADFTRVTSAGTDCTTTTTLNAGQTCDLRYTFDPATVGSKSATATVTSNAADMTVALTGQGTQTELTANPTSESFGNRDIDDGPTTPPLASVITNTGTEDVTISSVSFDSADFSQVTGNASDCVNGKLLHASDSCNVRLQFDPTTTGAKSGTATVHSNAANVGIALDGTGTQTAISSSPSSLDFGSKDIDEGATAAQTSVITNTGTEAVDVSGVAIGGTNPGQFELLSGQAQDCSTKGSITAGQTCEVRARFDPTTTGAKSATISIPGRPEGDVALTGTGIQTELSRSPGSLSFGNQEVDNGPTPSQTAVVTNSGTEPVSITSVAVTGDFAQSTGALDDCSSSTTLAAGETCKLRIAFDPTTTGARTGTATVHSNAADISVALDGTGIRTQLTPSPGTLSFGSQDIDDGATAAMTSVVSNSGTEPVSVTSVAVTGDFAQLTGNAGDCSASTVLTAGQTCNLRVAFDPVTTGPKTGTATVHSNAPNAVVSLSGTGIQTEITPAPSSLPFGSQDINAGPTAAQTSTVTNSGTEPVTITGVTVDGDQRSQFQHLTGNPDDCAPATMLAAGDTCKVRITFDPSWEGAKAATVTIASNAPTKTIDLSGTATQATFQRSDAALDGFLFDGAVNAVQFDSAGRIYVGGAFTSIGRRTGRGVKLTAANDQPDPAFPDVDGPVNAVAPDGSGGWFIGGSFATVGGTARANVAHILSSGALDTAWNPAGANGTVNAIAVSGGSVFVAGDFSSIGGSSLNRVAKLSATGSGAVSNVFAADANNTVDALAISGSNLYIGGAFTTINSDARARIAEVSTSTGDADPSFDPSADGAVESLAVDGTNLYAGGAFTNIGAQPRNRIAKLAAATGATDLSWDANSNNDVLAIAVDASGVYAGGAFTNIGAQPRNHIARLSSTTGAADSWDPNADGAVNGLSLSGTDVYTAGAFNQIGGQTRHRIARLAESDGSAEAWNPNANGTATAVAISGSDVYVGGAFTSVGAQTARSRIARLLPDGTVDPDWNPNASNTVNALLVNGSDVYAGGQFTSIGGLTRNRLARLTTATGAAADPTWNPDVSGTAPVVNALALSGSDLIVGGQFTTVSAQTHNRIAKVPTAGAGTADSTWVPSASGSVLSLATDGTNVWAGGTFVSMNSTTRLFVAKLSASGVGALDAWDASANGPVRALALSGSSLFAGGDFLNIGTQARGHVAKLDAGGTGSADMAWDASANATVRALAIAGSDLYAGGDFTQVGGASHNRVVRLPTGDGGAHDSGWNPISNGTVNALTASATRLAAGGAFTTVSGQSRQGVALFDLPRLWRTPSDHQFGPQDLADGPTAAQTTVVSNAGTAPVAFSSLTLGGTDAGDFERLTGNGTDCTASTTLNSGQTCEVRTRFDPSTTGIKSAWVEIDGSNTPEATIGLAGTGTQVGLSRSPSSLSFGSEDIDDGPAPDRQSVVTNTGSQPITINTVAITQSGSDFTRITGESTDCFDTRVLNAGESCNVRVQFDPSTTGLQTATATLQTDAGDSPISLDGTGTQTSLSRSPTSLAFGKKDIDDGAAATQTSTYTNDGTEPVHLTGVSVSGAGFSLVPGAGHCTSSTTLTAGQTCDVEVSFDPSATGVVSGSVTVSSTELPDLSVALSGEGTQTQLSPSPTSLSFGSKDIDDGATPSQQVVVTNSGTEAVTVSGVDVTGDFAQMTGNPDDCSASTVLSAGDTCKLRISFDPSAVHSRTGTATVHSNAPDASVSLDGTGIQTSASASPTSLAFGKRDIDDGPASTQSSTITNTGTETLHLTDVSVSGAGFSLVPGAGHCTSSTVLTEGQTCTVEVSFDPSATGIVSGSVTLSSSELPDLSVSLSGEGTQTELSRSPASLSFGGQDVDSGPTAAMTSTVTNSGTEPVTVSGVDVTGDFGQSTGNSDDCVNGTVLAAGDTCKLRITFDPTVTGARSGSATVHSNAADVSVALDGTGKQTKLDRSPTSLSFGSKDIDDGATAAQESTVTNVGTEDVTIGSVGIIGSDAGDFVRLTDQPSDCSTTTTLAAGQTCKVRVQFDPGSVGAKSATARVSANGVNQDVSLDGTGIQTQLSPSPASLSFGSKDIDDGATAAMTSTVTNSGTEGVTISSVAVTGDFAQVTGNADDCSASTVLAAGDTCKLRIKFDPSATGSRTGAATVHSNAPDASVSLDGTGIQTELSRSPVSLSFGNQDIDNGATPSMTSTVTNSGTEGVTLSGVDVTGDFAQQTGNGDDCVASKLLAAGDTCKLRVAFDPTATGSRIGAATVHSNAADVTVSLDGTGTQTELSPSPASLSFGSKDIDDGATAAMTSTVTNSGTEGVTISGVDVTGDFAQVTGNADDCSASTVLAAGDTCKLRIKFDPSATGSRTGAATVHSNAPDASVSLDGTGIQTELSRTPVSLSFGNQDIDNGATPSMTSTVTNSGTEGVTLSGVDVTGDFAQQTGNGDDCVASKVLAAGDTCKLRITFDPSSTGSKSGTATVHSNAADISVSLDGTGTQTELSPSPASLSFGSKDIDDGATAAMTSTVTNSGTEGVTISGVDVTGDFAQATGNSDDCANGTVLAAGATCKLRITFNPTATGSRLGAATVHSNAPDASVSLDGTGIQTELSRSPVSLSFGNQDIDDGATPSMTSTVTNSGTEGVTLSGVDVTGDFAQQTGNGDDCVASKVLAAGDTCKLRITFDPTSTGSKTGTATVHSNAADISVSLGGTGIQTELTPSPTSLSFGKKDIDDGQTPPQTVVVTNSGTEGVTLSGVAVTGDFAQITGNAGDCSASTVLAAGQTCNLRVAFDPSATGSRTGTATVNSNSAPMSVALDGTGIQTSASATPSTLSFGPKDIDEGATAAQTSTITNTGTETLHLTGVTIGGAGSAHFNRLTGDPSDCVSGKSTLAAGDTCKVRAEFNPSATGVQTATASVVSTELPAAAVVSLTGTGTQTLLSRAPADLALGSQDVDEGPTAAQTSTITNAGSEPVTLTAVNVSGGDFAQAAGASSDCLSGTTLAAGQTCQVRVRFDPSSVGAKTGTVTVTSNAADVTIGLSGTGIQTTLDRSPNALDFGSLNVAAPASAPQTLTLTNSGTQPISLSSVSLTGADATQFQRVSGESGDCGPGVVLAAGDTCAVRVRFRPTSQGPKTASVTVASDAGADVVIPLSGTGTPAPKLTIPSFRALARSTAHRRLKVAVVPVGGTIKTIVVEIRTPGGKLLGTGRLNSASSKRTVTVKLRHALAPGRYVAKGRGKDAFGHTVRVTRNFQLTLRSARSNGGGGGGGGGGSTPTGGGSG